MIQQMRQIGSRALTYKDGSSLRDDVHWPALTRFAAAINLGTCTGTPLVGPSPRKARGRDLIGPVRVDVRLGLAVAGGVYGPGATRVKLALVRPPGLVPD